MCEASLELLGSLFEKSLLRSRDERFFMLETIREFATQRLRDSGEENDLAERHCEHYHSFVETLVPNSERMQSDAVLRLDVERDNIRAALETLAVGGPDHRLADLAGRLWQYWFYRGLLDEGRRWLHQATEDMTDAPAARRVSVLSGLTNLSARYGDLVTARIWAEAEVETAKAAGLAGALAGAFRDLGNAYIYEDLERAASYYEQSIEAARAVGDASEEVISRDNKAYVEVLRGNFEEALEEIDRAATREDNPQDATALSSFVRRRCSV